MNHKENQTTIKKHNMNTYKINIGTEGTNYSKVIDAINQKYKRYFEEYNVKTEIGEYKGAKEETIHYLRFLSHRAVGLMVDP